LNGYVEKYWLNAVKVGKDRSDQMVKEGVGSVDLGNLVKTIRGGMKKIG